MSQKTLNPYREMSAVGDRLARTFLKTALNALLVPIDYTRTREIPALLESSGILSRSQERLQILDIGSPQILSLTLCSISPLWEVHYINPHRPELSDLSHKRAVMGLANLRVGFGDITDPESFAASSYDYIFSCSVWEHIAPEEGGDMAAAANLRALLRPGGRFSFSVPYYRQAFNEYVLGDVYAVKGGTERTFFQRFYDEESLWRRIIGPSGLEPQDLRYLGERLYFPNDISKRMACLLDRGKRRWLLGRMFKTIADLFMVESEHPLALKKPYLAICTLCNRLPSRENTLP